MRVAQGALIARASVFAALAGSTLALLPAAAQAQNWRPALPPPDTLAVPEPQPANEPRRDWPRPERLDARALLQAAVAQNAELLYARLQARIAAEGLAAEESVYQPVAYAALRREGRQRPRSAEERLTEALGGIAILDETVRAAEVGVRLKTESGADASLGLRSTERRNNVIASAPFTATDAESTSAVVLTVRQPLLRGAGKAITETDLRVAAAERDIGTWQFRQQLLRVGSDALSAYWQLQRATATQRLRDEALANAEAQGADVRDRIAGGRLAPAAQDDADALVALRRAERSRGAAAVAEAEARVRVILDLGATERGWPLAAADGARLVGAEGPAAPSEAPSPVPSPAAAAAERLPAAQAAWPALRVAQLRRRQAEDRLRLAVDRTKPQLDAQLSYSSNGLEASMRDATTKAVRGGNPDWTIGLAFEMPIGEDLRAHAQRRAQSLKLEQAQLEVHSVRQALASDLYARLEALAVQRREEADAAAELASRLSALAVEDTQHRAGVAPLARLLRRQAEAIDARLRHADVAARTMLAVIALQLVDGTLLAAHGVSVEE